MTADVTERKTATSEVAPDGRTQASPEVPGHDMELEPKPCFRPRCQRMKNTESSEIFSTGPWDCNQ